MSVCVCLCVCARVSVAIIFREVSVFDALTYALHLFVNYPHLCFGGIFSFLCAYSVANALPRVCVCEGTVCSEGIAIV